jgi:LysR family transcriptional activator of nhaA
MAEALGARGLKKVGTIEPLRERYYAISVERRLKHPAVVAVAGAARKELFTAVRQEDGSRRARRVVPKKERLL